MEDLYADAQTFLDGWTESPDLSVEAVASWLDGRPETPVEYEDALHGRLEAVGWKEAYAHAGR